MFYVTTSREADSSSSHIDVSLAGASARQMDSASAATQGMS